MEPFRTNRRLCIIGGISGIAGVAMLGISFAINNPPPTDATTAEILRFGQENYSHILWGAWLQAVGPVLLVLFAFTLVDLAGAAARLAGYMTLFGASVLMTVNLMEVGFYISRSTPLFRRCRSCSFLTSRNRVAEFSHTSPIFWLLCTPTGDYFCCLRDHFHAYPRAPALGYRLWWCSGALVARCFDLPDCSERKAHRAFTDLRPTQV